MTYGSTQFGLKPSDVVGFTDLQRVATEMQVTISIANEATWLYKNLKPPRYRNSYGFCQVMSGAFVVRSMQIEHLNQEVLHWRATEWGTNDAVVCGVKTVGLALDPPRQIGGIVVPTRQRFTSIRVRLYPGVEANIGLKWENSASGCNNTIEQPDPQQGNPLSPNNGNADPGGRPADQGGDPIDGSNNDGNDDPNDGKPKAPAPGNGSNFPHWHMHYSTKVPPDCVAKANVYDFPDLTNPAISPVYSRDRDSACPGTTGGNVTYNGAIVDTPRDIVSIQFFFY